MVTGEHGAAYLPTIVSYLDSGEHWFLRDAAARAIDGLGKEHAQAAVVPLGRAYARETHIVPHRKMKEALLDLDMAADDDELVPILVEALRSPPGHPNYDPRYFRATTLQILTEMGASAGSAIPVLEELAQDCERRLAAARDRERSALEAAKSNLEQALTAVRVGDG